MAFLERSNKSKLRDLEKVAEKVKEEYKVVRGNMSPEQIKQETENYKKMLEGKTKKEQYDLLEKIMPRAYAIAMEAIRQSFGYDVRETQILGAVGLHYGYVSEIATGEGKTTIGALPAYLNALAGDGVQIITPNEYLATRDAEKMKKVFGTLGLSVGVNLNSSSTDQKKAAYQSDIMYSTCTELGFDYLRDNMAFDPKQKVRRENSFDSFLLIDEADSIMLDEANVPLVISQNQKIEQEVVDNYNKAQQFVLTLEPDEFEYDEKDGTIFLTEPGVLKAEDFYGVENIADGENLPLMEYIRNALAANYLLERNDDYIITDKTGASVSGKDPEGQISLIDANTQRKLKGRQLSKGLHQAVEAKEGVAFTSESKIGSKTTIQNFVGKYGHFAGMTGTAMTDVEEFRKMYRTDVITIPQNENNREDDRIDTVYKTKKEKIAAIIERVKECQKTGRPVLVGVYTIDQSIEMSKAFEEAGIEHQLLNATFSDNSEREIVAQAGRKGAVTIATDMAGRGTDIKLGGNNEFMAVTEMKKQGYTPEEIAFASSSTPTNDPRLIEVRQTYEQLCDEFGKITKKEKQEVMAAGGLHIIGTEKHNSRRVDNQLRGRAGRQGDLGSSEFIISLEDDFIRIQDEEGTIKRTADSLGIREGHPVKSPVLTKLIERYQIMFEGLTSDKRKGSAKYDNILSEQRDSYYEMRDRLMEGEFASRDGIMDILDTVVPQILKQETDGGKHVTPKDYDKINDRLEQFLVPKGKRLLTKEFADGDTKITDLSDKIVSSIMRSYLYNIQKMSSMLKSALEKSDIKVVLTDQEINEFVEKKVIEDIMFEMLKNTNEKWSEHLENSEFLKQTSWLHSMAGRDPIDVYKEESWKALLDTQVSVFETSCNLMVNGTEMYSHVVKNRQTLRELALKNYKAQQSQVQRGTSTARTAPEQGRAGESRPEPRPISRPEPRPLNRPEPMPIMGRRSSQPIIRPGAPEQPQASI